MTTEVTGEHRGLPVTFEYSSTHLWHFGGLDLPIRQRYGECTTGPSWSLPGVHYVARGGIYETVASGLCGIGDCGGALGV
jgi:hypothetical protein